MTICHNIIDDCNYCVNCHNTSLHLHDFDYIDNVERIYNNKMNDDFVTAFLFDDDDDDDNDDDNDDDENMNTTANTMMSIKYNTVCNYLPSYQCDLPKYIETECFEIPPEEQLDTINMENAQIIVSRLSYDLSVSETVSDFRYPYMLIEKNYNDSHCIFISLNNKTDAVSAKKLEVMILKWKNSCMISFGTFGRKTLHGFLS